MNSTLPPVHRIATACRALIDAPWFSVVSFAVIVINAVVLGLETYDDAHRAAEDALRAVEYGCIVCFAVELLVRFGAQLRTPRAFFRDGWNLFDLFILLAPLLPGVRENVTVLRMLRLARIVRTFRLFPSLRVILVGIRRSLPGLGSFLLVTVLLLYGYAMLGWMMFADAHPDRYGTVGQAMLTLFLLLSLDGITDTLRAGRDVTEWAVLYYVSYMVAACFLLTNLLVGVVLNALQDAHQDERRASAAPDPAQTPPEDPAERQGDPAVAAQLASLRAAVDALEQHLARPAAPADPVMPVPRQPAAAGDGSR